jgi:GT2 family glycosyltransferase
MDKKLELDISVIIPFRNHAEMTIDCVKSLLKYGPDLKEILLINNNSDGEQLELIKNFVDKNPNVKCLDYLKPFNYQKMNNWAVKQSSGKFIFFLNNDTELTSQSIGLVEKMYQKASQKEVGMVGCLLLYGDGRTIQHAGVFLKPGLQGDHIYVGHSYKAALSNKGSKDFPYDIEESRELTAVTGAAQIVERSKFDQVGGFDERFIICGGDVDLCIRLNKKGFQTWYVGGGYILHKESQSRAHKPIPYVDFYQSYESYMKAFDLNCGDPFVPKITEEMK